jgi:hypothetical protein
MSDFWSWSLLYKARPTVEEESRSQGEKEGRY